jgi:hypothetical protein
MMGRAVLAVLLVIGGRVATAAPDALPQLPPLIAVKTVTATSTFPDKRDAYAAWRTIVPDHRQDDSGTETLWSAWCEGRKDEGIGEAVTVTLAEPTQIDGVRVAAGVWRTDKLFAANNQVTALEVIADGKSRTLKASGKDEWAELKIGAKVTTLVFKLAAVTKGRMNDSCISGIQLVQGGVAVSPVIGVDRAALAALRPTIQAIVGALEAPGKKGLEPYLVFPFSNLSVSTFAMVEEKPTKLASWAALVAACKGYAVASSKAAEEAFVSPRGCPVAADFDGDDGRAWWIESTAPGTIVVRWPTHREMVVTWTLVWKGGWKLQAIDFAS